jgi:hypothetical protein
LFLIILLPSDQVESSLLQLYTGHSGLDVNRSHREDLYIVLAMCRLHSRELLVCRNRDISFSCVQSIAWNQIRLVFYIVVVGNLYRYIGSSFSHFIELQIIFLGAGEIKRISYIVSSIGRRDSRYNIFLISSSVASKLLRILIALSDLILLSFLLFLLLECFP